MDADYPIPDPAWDYSEVWHHAQAAAAELRWRSPPQASLLAYMSTIEDATAETDENSSTVIG